MAIVFDATVGGSNATSYISVARADELVPVLVSKTRSDVWLALATADKEVFLMRAVRMMEAYIDWEGCRVIDDQPLAWPRDFVRGPDRVHWYYMPVTEIPVQVEEAQALMALNLSEEFDQASASGSPVEFIQVSSIKVAFESSKAARSSMLLPSEVVEKLRGFGDYVGSTGAGHSVTMVRG